MISHTVSIVELIWTAVCSIGLFYNTRILRETVEDYVNIRRNKINGIREYAATTTAMMFGSWCLIQFIFVAVGVGSMLIPSPNNHVATGSYIITVAFVSASAFLTISAYTTNARRRVLIQKIREIEYMNNGLA